ncbi:hypothetical protein HanPI659440_Chr15g0601001 [Helianthus annuus]|nr:hypothetical protein HanPI659440_Chr15g0601001 [Helianthus annuus]
MEISVNSNRPANRQGEKKMATTVKIRGDNRRILGDVNVGIGAQTHPRVLNKKALSRYVLLQHYSHRLFPAGHHRCCHNTTI